MSYNIISIIYSHNFHACINIKLIILLFSKVNKL